MAGNTYVPLTQVTQEGIIDYHKQITINTERQWNLREQMRQIDLSYIREGDMTSEQLKAKISNKNGDPNKIQNITVPVVAPQIFQAVAYQVAIFLSDYPIFGIAANPKFQAAAMQMQALIEENSIRGAWARELILFFYDGFKYNISALECHWDKEVTPALETDISQNGGQEGVVKNVMWQGNCLRRWDMYNTYFDTRCSPYDIPDKGEYAGHTEIMSKTALKAFMQKLDCKIPANFRPAFESPYQGGDNGQSGHSFHLPLLNPDALVNYNEVVLGEDWMGWVGLRARSSNLNGSPINYRGVYELSTEYLRLIPSELAMNVPERNTPQVWKFYIVNHSIIVGAERQTNAHQKIPVFFGCPAEDGLGFQTKSLAKNAEPFQQVASALMNSVLASRRRAITDRTLYDPSRVLEAHINNPNPAAKIPVRPAAYGKPVSESVHQFPFRDDQAGITIQEIQGLVSFGDKLNGQNAARQGQFVKGNKTDSQWEGTMNNATSKDQLTALLYEAQVFTPLKEVLKLNYMQYQGGTTIYSPGEETEVSIDPVELRKAVINFKVTDGILPKDKVLSTDTLKVAMQVIGTSQQLAQAYNLGPMFSYVMATENVDLTPFEKSPNQVAYEQAMMQWQQAAQYAADKEQPFNVPQPVPQQFGYNPQMQNPAMSQSAQQTQGGPQQATNPQAVQ
jgi:hypothetical protein